MQNPLLILRRAFLSAMLLFGGVLFGGTAFAQNHEYGALGTVSGPNADHLQLTIDIDDNANNTDPAQVRYYTQEPDNHVAKRTDACAAGIAPDPARTEMFDVPFLYANNPLILTATETTDALPTSYTIGRVGNGIEPGTRLCVLVYVPDHPELGAIVETYDIPYIQISLTPNAASNGITVRWQLIDFETVQCAHGFCENTAIPGFIRTPMGRAAWTNTISISRIIEDTSGNIVGSAGGVEIIPSFPVGGRAEMMGFRHIAGSGDLAGAPPAVNRFPDEGETWTYVITAQWREEDGNQAQLVVVGPSVSLPAVRPTVEFQGADQTVVTNRVVTLTATADPETQDMSLDYLRWTQVADADGTALAADDGVTRVALRGETDVTGTGADGNLRAEMSFTAPAFPSRSGPVPLYFQAESRDDDGVRMRVATVFVRGGASAPSPVRFSLSSSRVRAGASVTLTAAGGEPSDGVRLTYNWVQVDENGQALDMQSVRNVRDSEDGSALFPRSGASVVFIANPSFANAVSQPDDPNAAPVPTDPNSDAELASSVTLYFRGTTVYDQCSNNPDIMAPPCPPDMTQTLILRVLRLDTDKRVDERVLPKVLHNFARGVNQSIFQRIQQRQRQDGKWK